MNILVTGGLGTVGQPLLQRLVSQNHTVRLIDRSLENVPEGVEPVAGDITDFQAVREAMQGMEAVIHLAAIPNPAGATGPEIFRINCAGTYNVYEAAARMGIRRVVLARSINALGFNYGIKSFPIPYLPVDEETPTFTTDPYSFSKGITEEIATYYWRREGISGVQLRLPGVIPMTPEFLAMVQQFTPLLNAATEKLKAMPLTACQERARQLFAEIDLEQAQRIHEKAHSDEMPEEFWQPDPDDPLSLIVFGATDFWAVITGENSALAFKLGVLANYQGSHPLYVADPVNMLGMEAELLASIFYPDSARKRPLIGKEPLVSFARARQLIGYHPETSMDDWFN